MLRTVYGSKFAPDMSLGGLTGSPSPKYAGADISYKAPEVYGKVLDALLEPYAPAPNQGEIFRGIAQILTEEEAELWLSVPEYSYDPEDPPAQTVSQIAARVRPGLSAKAGDLIQSMLDKQFVFNMTRDGGEPAYMRTYMLWLCSTYTGREGSPLYRAMFNWFYNIIRGNSADMRPVPKSGNVMIALPNEVALTGDEKLGKVPMNLQIPDDRMVIGFDKTSEVINGAHAWAVCDCICRASTEMNGDRECDHSIDTCMLFDDDADLAVKMGWAKRVTREEMHDLVRRCRDEGLVQMSYNAEHPLSICNCCSDCCVFLNSLKRGENTIAGASRFIVQRLDGCRTCGQCMKICPMEVIEIDGQGAHVNQDKCIGCGLCVTKCNFGALQLTLRDPEDTSTGRACDYQKRAHI